MDSKIELTPELKKQIKEQQDSIREHFSSISLDIEQLIPLVTSDFDSFITQVRDKTNTFSGRKDQGFLLMLMTIKMASDYALFIGNKEASVIINNYCDTYSSIDTILKTIRSEQS